MDSWSVLVEILVLLAAALVLGTIAEAVRLSAIVGYLLAGALVGPNALGWIRSPQGVSLIAELGVGLLLFTIGLEFSLRQLRRLGRIALVGGTLQIVITGLAVAAAAMAVGCSASTAVVLGAMIAMSSTATVVRLLADRAALESPYGRNSLAILLLQDAAVLPLTLLVAALAQGGSPSQIAWKLGQTLLFGVGLVAVFVIVFNVIVPRVLRLRNWVTNRELPILLAVVMAIGSAAAAEYVHISPAIGAFLAGLLLAESPFAVQIRADVASLRTLLVTLFFASVGMLSDPVWAIGHWHLVLGAVIAVILVKAAIAAGIVRILRMPAGISLATGLCVAQAGEFSFVLANVAGASLLSRDVMQLVVSAAVLSLLVAPYLIGSAPAWGGRLEALIARRWPVKPSEAQPAQSSGQTKPVVLVIGFGPAGQRVAESLMERGVAELRIVELNVRAVAIAQRYGLTVTIGDAQRPEVLESAGMHHARAVVVSIPDPAAGRQIIHVCRTLNPSATLIVRARYHAFRLELEVAGAEVVVDEEQHVGQRLATEVRRALRGV